ncbi:hypothetical protein RMATCC62417_05160 [Rhizopus microsporus]|nr:hypothetical protein RMATCC62417_05160 [Rhizopus microsporus]
MASPVKQKRNRPCENCRTHRRKCISTSSDICERCQKMKLACIYTFTEKPAKPKTVSIIKQNNLLNAIWTLGRETELVRLQLCELQRALCTNCQSVTCQHRQRSKWNLTITGNQKGIQVNTSVKSLSDLELFIKEGLSRLRLTDTISCPDISFNAGNQMLRVTYPIMKVEQVFQDVFRFIPKGAGSSSQLDISSRAQFNKQYPLFKLKMIQNYFACFGLGIPILPYPIYYPKLRTELDSLLTASVVCLAAYSPCSHADLSELSFSRQQFAEHSRQLAKEMLQDALFEDDTPTPELCCALLLATISSIYALKGKEARIQCSLCWRMVNLLKPITPQNEEEAIQEQIRIRAYYLVRYLEFSFIKFNDKANGFGSAALNINSLPQPLPCEMSDVTIINAIQCYQLLLRLMAISSGFSSDEPMVFGFFGGVLEHVSSTMILALERFLIELWKLFPEDFKLGNGPFAYTDVITSSPSQNPFILHLNLTYYVYWVNFHCKIMNYPWQADMTGVDSQRVDGHRSLMIASICADTATQLYVAMEDVAPCQLDVHWISSCLDTLKVLAASLDPSVRERAQRNTAILSDVLKRRLQLDYPQAYAGPCKDQRRHIYSVRNSRSASVSSTSTSVSSSMSESTCESILTEDTSQGIYINHQAVYISPYFDQLRSNIIEYMLNNKIFEEM